MTGTSQSETGARQVVVARALSKTFPGQVALANVDLTIRAGQVHGLIGQNGSGKSTLIKILAGYHSPDPGGEVVVAGEPLPFGSPQESRRLGLRFMHQDLGVIAQLTVAENMALASGYARRTGGRIDWAAQREKSHRLLGRLAVDLDVDALAGTCAPVERSAIAIARALDDEDHRIRVLVLDEPTAALPPTEVERLFAVVEQVRTEGIGILYVSHRLDEVERLADEVSVLRDAKLEGYFAGGDIDRSALVEAMVGERVMRSARRERASVVASREGTEDALSVQGLRAPALSSTSFRVAAGEILGFAGLAGAGGDEAVRALVGAVPAEASRVAVGGRSLPRQTPADALKAGLVLVPANRETGSAVGEFVMRENVTLPSMKRYRQRGKLNRARERGDVEHWIEELDVQPANPEHLFSQLSGGNQQKVSLGKWLNTKPRVIALANPTSGVDVKAREAIYGIVRSLADAGHAFVISSTDVEDLVALCDRVLVFRDGTVVEELAAEQITESALIHSTMRDTAGGGPEA